MPIISIIVPVYNVEKYLDKCIQSILNQVFKNFELILVDDGSPDNCGKICDQYALRDSRIIVIHKANGGLSDARNAGLEVARGEYIGFVDSDDWIDPDMYQVLYDAAIQYGADIVECSYRNITMDGIKEETENTGVVIEADNVYALDCQFDWKYFKSVAVNKIYHKSIFSDGKRYPVGKHHEDEFFTHEAFYAAKRLIYLDVSKYNYLRTRNDSITGASFNEKGLDVCEALRNRLEFLKLNEVSNLIEKAERVYYWVVLDRIYKAKFNKINSIKLQNIINDINYDLPYIFKSNLSKQMKFELFIVAKFSCIYTMYKRFIHNN